MAGESSKLNISLSGAELYYVTLNNENIVTEQSEIELDLSKGINQLRITTGKDCQGIYEKTFVHDIEPLVYPNPIQNTLFISTNGFDVDNFSVNIYSLSGRLIFDKSFSTKENQLSIDLSNLSNGFFILNIVTDQKTYNYKIIKQ
jgi:hypothetical protein